MNNSYLVVGFATLLFSACSQKKEEKSDRAFPVKTAVVESRMEIQKEFSGIVEPVDFAKLAFRVSGQIINLPVIEGQKVKKGQLIAEIDTRDLALQYAADKAAYETASSQLERNKRLLGKQAISQQEYEISEANFQKSKSAYGLSNNNIRDTKLYAPFAGSVEKKLVENYQRVMSGSPIIQLVNTEKLRIKFTIPDAYMNLLKTKEQIFQVEFDTYKDKVFNAKLEEFLDISTYGTGIPVTITIDDPTFDRKLYEVKPGFTCNIKLKANIKEFIPGGTIIIPLSAIFEDTSTKKMNVWIVNNNKVERREVKVFSPTGDALVLISEGLKPGEQVVIAGVHQLIEGSLVKPIQ